VARATKDVVTGATTLHHIFSDGNWEVVDIVGKRVVLTWNSGLLLPLLCLLSLDRLRSRIGSGAGFLTGENFWVSAQEATRNSSLNRLSS
jgi:hypothetical protein